MKFREIHERALRIVGDFKRAEAELIDVLQLADQYKIFYHYGCKNLHEYTMRVLKLSESIAFNFIVVARKAKEVPQLKHAIQSGELSVSKARKITAVLTPQNQKEWLQMAVTLPQKKLEQEVARVSPKEATPEKLKFVSGDRLDLRMGISQELNLKLRRVQNLESQRNSRHSSLEDTLAAALEFYLEKLDPLRRASRALAKLPVARQAEKLNARVRHEVNLRDISKCTFVSDGTQCEEERWIDMHHVIPKSQGGTNSIENLRLLCRGHHKLIHHDLSAGSLS